MRFSIKFNIKLNRTVCTLLNMQFETLFIQKNEDNLQKFIAGARFYTDKRGDQTMTFLALTKNHRYRFKFVH